MEYLIYGKRNGIDKTFRALDKDGVRVSKKSEAMSYATKEDALEILNTPDIQKNIEEGKVEFDVRRG